MTTNHTLRDLLGPYGRQVLELLDHRDYDGHEPNPITAAVRAGRGNELVNEVEGGSEIALSSAATCCQMMKFNQQNGPEQDGKPKALRRHWYSWFKSEFAQPLGLALGQYHTTAAGVKQTNDRKWSSLLSKTCGRLVDSHKVTYRDLWVEDASRMMTSFYDELFPGLNALVAVEKDSLFSDFVAASKAIGAKALISGKGKQSKAATEKLLRDAFDWNDNWSRFSSDRPLRVIHVSDYDYDGEAVIGPTFGEQARRYTRHVEEARIGIVPDQVPQEEWESRSYKVKVSHKGSQAWAANNAVFSAGCPSCGHNWLRVGLTTDPSDSCPNCGADAYLITLDAEQPGGFEVEALTTREFYPKFVDALLTLIPFYQIVKRLREECLPDTWTASDTVTDDLLENNDAYQDTLAEAKALQDRLGTFRGRVKNHVLSEAATRQNDYLDQGEDPDPEDFRDHVREAQDHTGPWRPFSREERTDLLADDLLADDVVREALNWIFD